jgi:hypothetical protein
LILYIKRFVSNCVYRGLAELLMTAFNGCAQRLVYGWRGMRGGLRTRSCAPFWLGCVETSSLTLRVVH